MRPIAVKPTARAGPSPMPNDSWPAYRRPGRGIEFTFSKDGSLFSPGYLAQFDAFCFYTTGDLLAARKTPGAGPGGDGNPPLTPAGKAALLDAVASGKGFVGIHAAADTFHYQGETAETNTFRIQMGRYRNQGEERTDPYIRMLGGEFIIHGTQQTAVLEVVDPGFPGFARLGRTISRRDEWYSLKDFSRDLHVLLDPADRQHGGTRRFGRRASHAGRMEAVCPPSPIPRPGRECTAKGGSSTPRWATATTDRPAMIGTGRRFRRSFMAASPGRRAAPMPTSVRTSNG